MRIGKLDNDELMRLVLSKFKKTRPESMYAPEIGRDCCTLDLGCDLAVLSTDPITSAGLSQLGRLTVHINCNDAAAAGAEPVGLLVTVLAPPSITPEQLGALADDLAAAARDAGVDILGGHTEVTDAVTRLVTNAAVVAKLPSGQALRGMRAGDDLVMTKWAGLEGSAILAADYANRLQAVSGQSVEKAAALASFLSVVPESRIATENGATEMHDVTEGGILGAAWEMAHLAHCGAVIDTASIPILPETAEICRALSLDPLRLISSGSLLIACEDGNRLVGALTAAGIQATIIGKITRGGITDREGRPIDPPGADELYKMNQR